MDGHARPGRDLASKSGIFSLRSALPAESVFFHKEVLADVHKHRRDPANICMCMDRYDLMRDGGFYDQVPSGKLVDLAFTVTAHDPGDRISYFSGRSDARHGLVSVHDRDSPENRLLRRHSSLRPLLIIVLTAWFGFAEAARGQVVSPIPPGWNRRACSTETASGRAIWGTVHDASRQPLAGVQVYAPALGCGMLTDSAGRYAVTGLPLGGIAFIADLIGYVRDSTAMPRSAEIVRHEFVLFQTRGDEQFVYEPGANPWNVRREVAADIVGCYAIDVLEDYGPPITPYGGPSETKPRGFQGLPVTVLLDTFGAPGDTVALVGRTLRHTLGAAVSGEPDGSWAWRFTVSDDTLYVSWEGSPNLWWIRYRLLIDTDSLLGNSWYVSHEPGSARPPRPTVWHRTRCLRDG